MVGTSAEPPVWEFIGNRGAERVTCEACGGSTEVPLTARAVLHNGPEQPPPQHASGKGAPQKVSAWLPGRSADDLEGVDAQ